MQLPDPQLLFSVLCIAIVAVLTVLISTRTEYILHNTHKDYLVRSKYRYMFCSNKTEQSRFLFMLLTCFSFFLISVLAFLAYKFVPENKEYFTVLICTGLTSFQLYFFKEVRNAFIKKGKFFMGLTVLAVLTQFILPQEWRIAGNNAVLIVQGSALVLSVNSVYLWFQAVQKALDVVEAQVQCDSK